MNREVGRTHPHADWNSVKTRRLVAEVLSPRTTLLTIP